MSTAHSLPPTRTGESAASSAAEHDPGAAMHALAGELFPLHRAITGEPVRRTLRRLADFAPLEIREVPSGKAVFDWEVPEEWNLREAWIQDATGERVVDCSASNLHVVNYSRPIRCTMRWSELRPHLFALPDQPDSIPYRTGYFRDTWGFCLTHRQLEALEALGDQPYEVCIDARLSKGSLSYGEIYLPGTSDREILFTAHTCHPSLANDNLSGIVVATFLARILAARPRRHSFRFLFAPATIGPITWLSENRQQVDRIRHGLVLTLLGAPGPWTYKRSRRGDADIDRVVAHVLAHMQEPSRIREFTPTGYDERQFCSPGFDLPMGCLMRHGPGEFPQYHTSADDLDLIRPETLAASLETCLAIVDVLEHDRSYRNLYPHGEPQLGRRGIYRAFGEQDDRGRLQEAMLWTLNMSDGRRRLLAIAERSGLPFSIVRRATDLLCEHGLLEEVDGPPPKSNGNHVATT